MKRIISGIQPTNKLTLGNYLGAIKQLVESQDKYEMYIFIADLHSLSTNFDAQIIYQNKLSLLVSYQALGLDVNKSVIFNQSDIAAHTALYWVLTCHITMGELSRMTQYKEKSQKHVLSNRTTSAPTGLFMYPVLMAADILLYDADFVIVGNDQKQHIELTRDVALRMNNKYGKLFKVPEPIIPKHGARIMDLVNPLIKMSKSNLNEKGTIFLLDKPQDVINKINSAKTDSLNKVKYDPQNQPGISNLLVIYSCLTNLEINGIVDKYKEQTYSIFKNDLAKIVSDFLINFQSKYEHIINDSQKLTRILEQNAKKCKAIADNKLLNIYRSIGLIK